MPLTPPQREPAATATQPLDEDSDASPAKEKGAPEPPRPAPSSASTARRQPVFDNEEAPAPSENDPPASEATRRDHGGKPRGEAKKQGEATEDKARPRSEVAPLSHSNSKSKS